MAILAQKSLLWSKKIWFTLLTFSNLTIGYSQCAMCRAVIENEDGANKGAAVNDGIVYLMAIPYILVAILGFVIYKSRQKNKT